MRFELKRPCPKCPFRKDCQPQWLGRARAAEIADALLGGTPGRTFACHETTHHDDESGEHVQRPDEQHCVGALLLVESEGAANQMIQVAERLGLFDPEVIDPKARSLIFETRGEFEHHHADASRDQALVNERGGDCGDTQAES